METETFL